MRKIAAVLVVAVLCSVCAWAQTYPSRPVIWVAAMAPGGATDTVSRELSQKLTARWGQPVVVDSMGGAAGLVAAQRVKNADPNGLTFLVATNSLLSNQVMSKKPDLDLRKDFAAVAMWFEAPYAVFVNPSLPAQSLQEVLAYAKANPGKLNYGSTGVGSGTHLIAEDLKMRTGIDLVQINYKGAAPLMLDLIANRVQITFLGFTGQWQQQVEAGKMRVLAVTTTQRLSTLPNVPTAQEQGLQGLNHSSWVALFAPANTPMPVLNRVNSELRAILTEPELSKRYLAEHRTLPLLSVEETQKRIADEIALQNKLIDVAGIERQ